MLRSFGVPVNSQGLPQQGVRQNLEERNINTHALSPEEIERLRKSAAELKKREMLKKWYTTWTKDEKSLAIYEFFQAHRGDYSVAMVASKILYFQYQPHGFIGVPAWIEQSIYKLSTHPEFPYEILYNIFNTGNNILLPPQLDDDDPSTHDLFLETIPTMGFAVQFWWPNINKSLFPPQLINEFENLMKNKTQLTIPERILGKTVGQGSNYIIPKELNPKIAPIELPSLSEDDWSKLKIAGYVVGGLFILGAGGFAASEIKSLVEK